MAGTVLDDLIAGASGDEVRVATLLRKVKIVASRVGAPMLDEWVEHELNGYPDDATLPDYRKRREVEVRGDFAGPFTAATITAGLVPQSGLRPPEGVDLSDLFAIEWREPISEIESLIKGGERTLKAQWTAEAIAYVNGMIQREEAEFYPGMYVTTAYRLLSRHAVAALVDRVRTRILDLALALESVSPDVGTTSLPEATRDEAKSVVFNLFGSSANIALGPGAEQTMQSVTVGDRESLHTALRALGLAESDLAELDAALEEDDGCGRSPGVRAWLGKHALEAASAAGQAGAAETAKLIARAVATYFGLDG